MKICYFNPTILIRRPLADLVELSANAGHEVTVFSPRKPFAKIDKSWHSNKKLEKANIITYPAINPFFLKSEWPIPITPGFFFKLRKIRRENELIHMWTFFYIATAINALYKSKSKVLLSCDTIPQRSFVMNNLMGKAFDLFYKTVGAKIFSSVDKIHLYGQALVPHAKTVKIPEEKIEVIPTGVHLKAFEAQRETNTDEIRVLYAGLIVPRKGVDTLLRAMSKVESEKIKAKIIGNGPSKKEMVQLAAQLGIKDRVIFTNWVQDMSKELSKADILVLASHAEGLPGIVMEAMAARLPVITSHIPCITDLIINENQGILIDPTNLEKLTQNIDKLAQDPQLRARMGSAARERIKEFSWEKLYQKYESLYSKMVSK